MTTRISINNLDSSVTANFSPKISGIAIADNSYTVLDDTAVSVSGGYIIISGSNFVSGCTVLVGSVVATSVSFVNSTTVRAQVPAQAAGSYTVYVTNPDGGLAIRVNGLNYSATPTWVTTSPLTSGLVNTAISIQLSATSNGNVTYALQAGSSLPVGVTLSNVGLLSGTVTGITTDTTYNFTVVATDTELQDTPQAFSITITSNDQYFKNTSLLLSANTPGATFVSDASTNAFNVSVFGDTRPSDLSPYKPGYYSILFDTKTDFVSVPAVTNLTTFAGDFTFETWVYLNDTSVTNWSLWDARQSGATAQPMIFNIDPLASPVTGQGRLMYYNGSYNYGTGVVNYNQWTHIAFVRSGSTMTFYVNGVAGGTATVSGTQTASATTNPIYIGSKDSGIAGYGTIGYISNFRIVNGTAVYTGNFTPSTAPLTAITNTVFLIAQSNRYVDNSTNAYALTNSSTSVSSFVPFTPAAGTSTNGSAYFDGTGDYLRSQLDSVNIRTAFTIEAWVYLTTTSGFILFSASNTANVAGSNLYLNISGGTIYFGDGVINNITFSSSLLVTNIWNHIAITFDGTTYRVFVNGTLAGSSTTLLANNTLNGIDIGARISENLYITGYISNFRVVKGTAVYTATFTPPTAPLTAVANTSLLTLQTNQPANNNQFVDRSTNNFLITRNGNATAGSFSPYAGGWSWYFDGSTTYLNTASDASLGFGTGDFTVEFFIFPTATANTWSIYHGSTTNAFIINTTTDGRLVVRQYGVADLFTSTASLTNNIWNHVAVARSGTTLSLWLNGSRSNGLTGTNSTNFATTAVYIGRADSVTNIVQGYISNLRTVKGTAVYNPSSTTITVPTAPLLPIAGTSLLTCADNRFIDDSANNFNLTRTGSVSVQKFSPFSMQTQTVPTSYSGYFDGNGDYLSNIGNTSSFNFLHNTSALFTIEAWVYVTSTAFNSVAMTNASTTAAIGCKFMVYNDNKLRLFITNGTAGNPVCDAFSTTTVQLNTWNHIAVTYNHSLASNNAVFYINGVQSGTGSKTANSATNSNSSYALAIGATQTLDAGYFFTGYISNLRIVNSIIYNGNFTPSTTPLTAIANTSLLACQSTTFIDNSANAFAITANGDVRPSQVNPFGYTNPAAGAYTVTALGGSMYFDGTGDYLSVADNIALDAFTDFTIEGWVYFNSAADNQIILNKGWDASSTFSPYIIWTTGGNLVFSGSTDGSTWALLNQTIIPSITTGRWYHFAVTRSGSTVRYFNNGALTGTSTVSAALMNSIYDLTVGSHRTGGYYLNGYISDLRVIKGQALYTSNFVPPAAPLDAVRNTTLLLRGTAASVYDSTMINNLETVGDARVNTSIVKFAGKPSMYFDGTGDRLDSQSNPIFNFGTANFTVEFWVYPTAWTTGDWDTIFAVGQGTNNGGLLIGKTDTELFTIRQYGIANRVSTSTLPTLNAWTHVACVRSSGTSTIYYNGTSIASAADSTDYTTSQPFAHIGNSDGTTYSHYFAGYLSDFRVTRGVARYTTNFTAPTSPSIQY